jgi:hypothetical protein
MKKLLHALLVAAALLPATAHAQSYTAKVYKDQSGNRETVASGGTLRLQAGSAVDVGGPTYSTALTGNPFTQASYKDLTVATDLVSTAMTTIIASTAGTTIYPRDVSIMVSGTAATATALALECSDGTLIASWPVADLVDRLPIGTALYLSTQSTITTGPALVKGCPASTAVMLSNAGTLITTTSHVYTNVEYVTQH